MNVKLKIKQLDSSDCGAACIASICAYFGLEIPITLIRQYACTGKNGTSILGIVEAFKKVGIVGKGVMADIKAIIAISRPVIAHMVIRGKYTHYITIYKVNGNNITYMDPYDGEFHSMSISTFQKSWSGVLVTIELAENFMPGNRSANRFIQVKHIISANRRMFIMTFLFVVISTLLGVSVSIYIGKITDFVISSKNMKVLNNMGFIMVCIILIQILVSLSRDIALFKIGQKTNYKLILDYYKHILKLPQTFFDNMMVGEFLSRMDTNGSYISKTFINYCFYLTSLSCHILCLQ